ncbi:uncharacterized protein TrAtP1_001375 [Trichoderma atroviride]|uniref:GPI anchored protein n=1 Tax=Hypocrea atroviridis (strain ATCC 20476 / IMI 206040) TaxID=452589 RepID=G9P1V4_HYPAI|nr:uncharacterized protein TRIATDRAFT_301224 [Trichoderma atroviride IMI 206040]EHK43382.1 hypothetical protein TRIATDRAFT_301224 [Trichoderma atroviride IMI 206040]UKZ60089.1 hypothetical protein TrAtP1_001375 [Trichoderma atroviride]
MARSLALLALASGALAAQSTTVGLLLPYADIQTIDASIIGADSTATTYLVGCPKGEDSSDCGFATSQTITQGPSTWIYTATFSADPADETDLSGSEVQGGSCKLNTKADAADCTMYMTATVTGSVTSTTSATTMTFLDVQTPVTVTAGFDKLKAAPGSTATDASTTAPASTDASSTGPAQTTLSKHTSTGTQTGSSTSKPTSTNAAGIVNSQGGLLAGVAAIVGGAMML